MTSTTTTTTSSRRLMQYSLVGGVAGRGLQVLQLFLVAWLLGSAEFGLYAAAYSTIMATAALFSSAVCLGINRFVSTRHRGRSDLRTVVAVVATLAVVTAVLGVLGSASLLSLLSDGTAEVDRRLFVTAGIVLCADAALASVAGSHQPRKLATLDFARGLGAAVGGSLGAVLAGPEGALVAFAITEGSTAIAAFALARPHFDAPHGSSPASVVREIASVTGPGMVSGIAVQVALWTAQIWTLRHGSLTQYAALAMSIRLGNVVAMVPGMLTRNFLARLSSSRSAGLDEWRSSTTSYLRQNLLLTLVCLLPLVPAGFVVRAVLGDAYDSLPLLLPLLGACFFLNSVASSLGVVLVASGSTWIWVLSDIVLATALVLTLTLSSLSDPNYTYVAAFGLSSLLCLAMRWPFVQRTRMRSAVP